jgi:hypothetical protein
MAEDRDEEVHVHTNVPKPYAQFLIDQQGGTVHAELSEKLRDLVEAIEMHFNKFPGKTEGEIKIHHKIILDRGAYKVVTKYEIKYPKAPQADTIMWLGPNGDLQSTNPKQLTMGFGEKPRVVV